MQSGLFQRGGLCAVLYGAVGVLHYLEEVMSLPRRSLLQVLPECEDLSLTL